MQSDIYQICSKFESEHWWFVARRAIVQKAIDFYFKNPNDMTSKILEVGAGSGGNLEMLSAYGNVFALEMDEKSCQFAQNRNIGEVMLGKLPDQFPFDNTFDLICMLDVLEHIEDDFETLCIIKEKLNATGKLVITVPAYQWLWSQHDVVAQHYRRYNRKSLTEVITQSGLKVKYMTYFNTFLFPVVASVRLVNNVLGKNESSDLSLPIKGVNNGLKTIFASERFFFPKITFPFGVSLLAVLENI
tara:strand:+ start:2958 stop:3692 length:735 start_codon:yes stop_codon:yes gene_type:complete